MVIIMHKDRVLIIIPAYNEAKNLPKVLDGLSGFDYIVVNDGSIDSTKKVLEDLKANHINLAHNLGIGGAVQTGYKYALENNYDIVVQFDADGQHDAECIQKIVKPILNDEADFVIGSRFVNKNATDFKSTVMRRVGIRAISNLIRLLAHRRIFDTTSGFRAANKAVISKFAENYPLEYPEPISNFELLKQGFRLKEVPVNMKKRAGGRSSIRYWRNGYYMLNVFLAILMVQIRSKDGFEF